MIVGVWALMGYLYYLWERPSPKKQYPAGGLDQDTVFAMSMWRDMGDD